MNILTFGYHPVKKLDAEVYPLELSTGRLGGNDARPASDFSLDAGDPSESSSRSVTIWRRASTDPLRQLGADLAFEIAISLRGGGLVLRENQAVGALRTGDHTQPALFVFGSGNRAAARLPEPKT